MATRTISTGNDVEAALAFLAKEKNTSGEQYFMDKVQGISDDILKEADDKRFALAHKIMTEEKDKGKSISKLRELLGA